MANESNAPSTVQAALSALQSGKDVAEAVYGDVNALGTPSGFEDEGELSEEGGFNTESFMAGEESQEASEEPQESEGAAKAASQSKSQNSSKEDIEEIIISDEGGRKKLKVNFADREQLKKYVQMAAGSRKWQAERDQARKEVASVKPEYEKLKGSWDAMEQAFKSQGIAGVIDLLQGERGAYDKHIQAEFQRRQAYEDATPSERERLDLQERIDKERREKQEAQQQMKEYLAKVQAKEEKAQEEALKGVLYPAFDKYRFAGKLGDDVLEAELDDAVWTKAIKKLDAYDEAQLTPELVEREFRSVAGMFKKVVASQTNKEVKSVMSAKKQNATEQAAARSTSGMRSNADADAFRDSIRKGDLVSAFKGFASGKFRL